MRENERKQRKREKKREKQSKREERMSKVNYYQSAFNSQKEKQKYWQKCSNIKKWPCRGSIVCNRPTSL